MRITPAARAEPPPTAAPPRRPAPQPAPERARLDQAVDKLNKTAAIFNRQIRFQLHEATGRLQVRVVDQTNGDVVAEFPPEKLLDVLAAIQEQVGLILDQAF